MSRTLTIARSLGLAAALLLLTAGCRPPGLEYVPTGKIDTVDDLEDLMWVQADTADPRFDLAEDLEENPGAMTDAQAREFIDMGVRLQASAKRLVHFTRGEDFTAWSKELGTKATALEHAARAGDGKKTVSMALSVRQTCRTCHDKYK